MIANPFTYWVGMETDPRTTPEALAEFNHFYSTTHVHEVIAAHPGFVRVSRYELVQPDPRGGEHRGPRWLAVYAAKDEAAALQYIKDNERPWLHRKQYSPWPAARKRAKIIWRMLWQQISATDVTDQPADSIVMVGTSVPPDPAARASTFALYREFAHPAPGCPRFCIISAVEPAATEPAETVWRLGYRLIPPPS